MLTPGRTADFGGKYNSSFICFGGNFMEWPI